MAQAHKSRISNKDENSFNNQNVITHIEHNWNQDHPDFPENLKIVNHHEFGRSVFTTSDIEIGDTVASVSPFAFTVISNDVPYCLTCGKTELSFIPCDNCQKVFFCNNNCKFQNRTHEYECGTMFHSIRDKDVDTGAMSPKCVIQMVLEAIAAFDGNVNELQSNVRRWIANKDEIPRGTRTRKMKLECIVKLRTPEYFHFEEHLFNAYGTITNFPKIEQLFNNRKKKLFLRNLLAHFLQTLYVNGFGLGMSIGDPHGRDSFRKIVIFDIVSFFNHSCVPNLLNVLNENNEMTFIASRNIHRNEQLFITYKSFIEPSTPTMRRLVLMQYDFYCRCEKCTTEDREPNEEILIAKKISETKNVKRMPLGRIVNALRIQHPFKYTHEIGAQMDCFHRLFTG